MEHNYNIDKHLSDSLKDFSVKPAPDSFGEMMEKLEQKRKRKRFFILLYSGIGTIAASLLFFYLVNMAGDTTPANDLLVKNPGTAGEAHTRPVDMPEEKKQPRTPYAETPPPVKEKNNRPVDVAVEREVVPSAFAEKKGLPVAPSGIKKGDDDMHSQPENPVIQKARAAEGATPEAAPTASATPVPLNGITRAQDPAEHLEEPADKAEALAGQTLSPVFLDPVYPVSQAVVFNEGALLLVNPQPLEDLDRLTQNKRVQVLLGVNFNPQFSRFLLTENKGRDAEYDTPLGKTLSKEYLNEKRQMNTPYFSYALGVKAGLAIRNHWEFWVGTGIQTIQFFEKAYPVPAFSNTYTTYPTSLQSATAGEGRVKIEYSYWYYQAEVKRNVQVHPFLKMNVGFGVKWNHWYSLKISSKSDWGSGGYSIATESLNDLAQWFCTVDLKSGVIYDLGRRWQLRLTPGVFYSPTSIFNRHYVINQNSYGLELEAMVVFKI